MIAYWLCIVLFVLGCFVGGAGKFAVLRFGLCRVWVDLLFVFVLATCAGFVPLDLR